MAEVGGCLLRGRARGATARAAMPRAVALSVDTCPLSAVLVMIRTMKWLLPGPSLPLPLAPPPPPPLPHHLLGRPGPTHPSTPSSSSTPMEPPSPTHRPRPRPSPTPRCSPRPHPLRVSRHHSVKHISVCFSPSLPPSLSLCLTYSLPPSLPPPPPHYQLPRSRPSPPLPPRRGSSRTG